MSHDTKLYVYRLLKSSDCDSNIMEIQIVGEIGKNTTCFGYETFVIKTIYYAMMNLNTKLYVHDALKRNKRYEDRDVRRCLYGSLTVQNVVYKPVKGIEHVGIKFTITSNGNLELL